MPMASTRLPSSQSSTRMPLQAAETRAAMLSASLARLLKLRVGGGQHSRPNAR